MSRLTISLLILLLFAPLASAQQYRPYSGKGLILIRPLDPEQAGEQVPVVFYREPGVARVAERPAREIPRLSVILDIPSGAYPLAVMGSKGKWLRIPFDDAGREGWVEMARWWEYISWDAFLKGRIARFLPGLKKGSNVLRTGPDDASALTETILGGERMRMTQVEGDWVRVVTDSGLSGWLAWRDGDGRFQITIEEDPVGQKR